MLLTPLGRPLFDASPLDIAVFSTVAGVFVLTGLAACLVPVTRASVINPLEALKCERFAAQSVHR